MNTEKNLNEITNEEEQEKGLSILWISIISLIGVIALIALILAALILLGWVQIRNLKDGTYVKKNT